MCASALVPIALGAPGLPAVAAGLTVVGSVGGNVLASLIGESLNAARARTRARSPTDPDAASAPDAVAGPDTGGSAFAELVRQELAARIEQVLAAQDQQAEALAATLALVLERIDATAVVVGEVVVGGQEQLLRELMAGFAGLGEQVAGLGPLLRGLDGSVVRLQQSLARQDAEHRFDRSQQQWVIALLLEFHEQLAELAIRLPDAATTADPGPVKLSAVWAGRCPYQGLAPFGPAQTAVFYGRGQYTARLLTMVATHTGSGPIIVTGASGAGKSSLLHAGLLPELRMPTQDSLAAAYGTADWPQITFTPGSRPLEQLAVQLAVRCHADPDHVLNELRTDPAGAAVRRARQVLATEQIRRASGDGARARAQQGPQRLIVVVDQFEELFTLASADYTGHPGQGEGPGSPREDEAFVSALEALTARPDVDAVAEPSARSAGSRGERGFTGRAADRLPAGLVVLAVRGDFLDRCSAYSVLARALEEKLFVLDPMNEQELRRTITGPAAAAGLRVEDGLAEQIVNDLISHLRTTAARPGRIGGSAGSGAAGALPLLSMAMARTWLNREGTRLTHAAYDHAGGVASAVTDTAEDTYTRLDPRQQQIAQRILLALTITGTDGQISRRRIPLTELTELSQSADGDHPGSDHLQQVQQVVEAFTTARLMTAMSSAGASDLLPEPTPTSAQGSAAGPTGPGLGAETASTASLTRSRRSSDTRSTSEPAATVELAHDVLLTAWPRLRSWLAEDRADRIVHGQIAEDAAEWDRSGRDASFLYRGSRLEDAQTAAARWRTDPGRYPALGLSDAASAFLAASTRATTRTRRRWQAAAGVLAGLLVIAVITAVTSVRFGRDADQQRDLALSRSAQFLSRQTAAHSESLPDDPATSARLAAAAWSISKTDEASASMAALLSQPQRAVLTGHTHWVFSVAYSPDGTRLATGSADGTVRIWDARTAIQLGEPLIGHAGAVRSVVFSPDGTRLATGSDGSAVRIWDARTGTPIGNPLIGHSKRVSSVVFSLDGSRLASGSDDGTVRIWDARTGTPIGEPLTGHTSWVNSVAFSPDGTRLATGSADKTVRIWDARTGTPIGEPLTGHTGEVHSVALSPDGTRVASGGEDGKVRMWDARTGAPISKPLDHTGVVWSVAFSPDGTRLASGSADDTVQIWDARTGTPVGEPLTGHTDDVNSVVFSPDGTQVASGSNDFEARIWDARTGAQLGEPLISRTDGVSSVAFSPDGSRLATGGDDGTVRIWDARTGTPISKPLVGHTGVVWSAAFSPDGTRLATGSFDGTVRMWDARTGTPIGEPLTGHTSWVSSVAFSLDGSRLATADSDFKVRIWDARTGAQLGKPLTGHIDVVQSVTFSPDGTRLATASDDRTARIWDARTATPIGQPLTGHIDWVQSVAFSPDGTRLATGSADKTVRIWDARTGTQLGKPLIGHTDEVSSVEFSPDGTRLATGGKDLKVRIWDARTGIQLGGPLAGHTGLLQSVAFSPDGTQLATGSDDDTTRIWDVALPRDPLGAVCAIAHRGFTPEEWRQYIPDAYRPTCPASR
ncbi:hypothetical protein Acor_83280 [Acrocarpospora corrugata]|uniref:Novel STAND NTPase 1 domain-containing protein n=1 Tax=Acrocarpospora corrugata TaxID=35763 RepID=A0A5M3WD46_9ACTN|nr:hypothetical protein Acor_83280 [Acrocarpospora corrugata]